MKPALKWLAGSAAVVAALAAWLAPGSTHAAPGGGGGGGGDGSVDPGTSNWGKTPDILRDRFADAELAAKIPGLGRFLAVWGWSIGKGRFVPNAHNESQDEIADSEAGYDNNPDWPNGIYGPEWRSGGSWGLFDFLAGTHARDGIHEGFSPLVDYPVDSLRRVDVQLYLAGWVVYRLVKGPLPVLVAGDPARTWANIRAAAINPSGYANKSAASADRIAKFYTWGADLGVDLAALAMPTVKDFPGPEEYWKRLRVFERVDDTLPGVLP